MVLEARLNGQNPSEKTSVELVGIEQALSKGNKLHGFLSGGGLRVIRLELGGKLTGYGEHYSVDTALLHADEDFLAGGRNYDEVYGKLYPHYLTGSHEITSPLDGWLLRGHTVDAQRTEEGLTRVELTGLTEYRLPQAVLDQTRKARKAMLWKDRGYTYRTIYNPHLFPNGDPGHSTEVVDYPQGKESNDAWMYYQTKTGEGVNFNEALDKAFEAPGVEIDEQHR